MTKNVPLRGVQFKILHNAYPTMKHLFHWRIKASPNCTSCNVPENTIHAIWDCNIARQTIGNLQSILNTVLNNRGNLQITSKHLKNLLIDSFSFLCASISLTFDGLVEIKI